MRVFIKRSCCKRNKKYLGSGHQESSCKQVNSGWGRSLTETGGEVKHHQKVWEQGAVTTFPQYSPPLTHSGYTWQGQRPWGQQSEITLLPDKTESSSLCHPRTISSYSIPFMLASLYYSGKGFLKSLLCVKEKINGSKSWTLFLA